MHWAAAYIGLPWSAHGSGPDLFNCWEFVRAVQDRHFGRVLPDIANPEDMLAMGRTFRDHPERQRWAKVADPLEGDCVLLRRSRHPIHVGVWLDVDGGGVLHCAEGAGVVFQRPDALHLNGWAIEGRSLNDPSRTMRILFGHDSGQAKSVASAVLSRQIRPAFGMESDPEATAFLDDFREGRAPGWLKTLCQDFLREELGWVESEWPQWLHGHCGH